MPGEDRKSENCTGDDVFDDMLNLEESDGTLENLTLPGSTEPVLAASEETSSSDVEEDVFAQISEDEREEEEVVEVIPPKPTSPAPPVRPTMPSQTLPQHQRSAGRLTEALYEDTSVDDELGQLLLERRLLCREVQHLVQQKSQRQRALLLGKQAEQVGRSAPLTPLYVILIALYILNMCLLWLFLSTI